MREEKKPSIRGDFLLLFVYFLYFHTGLRVGNLKLLKKRKYENNQIIFFLNSKYSYLKRKDTDSTGKVPSKSRYSSFAFYISIRGTGIVIWKCIKDGKCDNELQKIYIFFLIVSIHIFLNKSAISTKKVAGRFLF